MKAPASRREFLTQELWSKYFSKRPDKFMRKDEFAEVCKVIWMTATKQDEALWQAVMKMRATLEYYSKDIKSDPYLIDGVLFEDTECVRIASFHSDDYDNKPIYGTRAQQVAAEFDQAFKERG